MLNSFCIHFVEYKKEELHKIAQFMASAQQYKLTKDAKEASECIST